MMTMHPGRCSLLRLVKRMPLAMHGSRRTRPGQRKRRNGWDEHDQQ